MTNAQVQHHTEQTEAMRRDFQALWIRELMPRIVALGGTKSIRDLGLVKAIAWQTLKAAKQL